MLPSINGISRDDESGTWEEALPALQEHRMSVAYSHILV